MIDKVEQLYEKHGRKVSLVGWSLGGVYARQLAKMMPDKVRLVISLGSPFAGDPRATNAWKLYEYTSGHKVDDRERHMGGKILRRRRCRRPRSTAARTAFAIGAIVSKRKARIRRTSRLKAAIAAWSPSRRRLRHRRPPRPAGRQVEKV